MKMEITPNHHGPHKMTDIQDRIDDQLAMATTAIQNAVALSRESGIPFTWDAGLDIGTGIFYYNDYYHDIATYEDYGDDIEDEDLQAAHKTIYEILQEEVAQGMISAKPASDEEQEWADYQRVVADSEYGKREAELHLEQGTAALLEALTEDEDAMETTRLAFTFNPLLPGPQSFFTDHWVPSGMNC